MKIIAPVDLTSGRIMLIAEIDVKTVLGKTNNFTVKQILWMSDMSWMTRIWKSNPKAVIADLENDIYTDDSIFNESQIISKVFNETL